MLSQWKIKYDINNNTDKYNWASKDGKGVIYYMKDEFGFVHLRGMVKGGTVGRNAFMLPEGYKPLKSQYHMCISADIVRTLNVQSNGGVLISAVASNAWVTLNGISFKAEA